MSSVWSDVMVGLSENECLKLCCCNHVDESKAYYALQELITSEIWTRSIFLATQKFKSEYLRHLTSNLVRCKLST